MHVPRGPLPTGICLMATACGLLLVSYLTAGSRGRERSYLRTSGAPLLMLSFLLPVASPACPQPPAIEATTIGFRGGSPKGMVVALHRDLIAAVDIVAHHVLGYWTSPTFNLLLPDPAKGVLFDAVGVKKWQAALWPV